MSGSTTASRPFLTIASNKRLSKNDPALLEKWQYMMANLSAAEGKEKASKNIARNIADVLNIKEAMPKKIN